MSTVSARPALINDLPAIVGLLADDVLGQGREDIGLPLHSNYFDAFEAIEDDPNQVFVVFEAEGVIVGCLQLASFQDYHDKGHGGQIESVRISSERRAGLGQEMIGWAIDTCRERGCQIIQLTSDKRGTTRQNFIARSVLLRLMRDSSKQSEKPNIAEEESFTHLFK